MTRNFKLDKIIIISEILFYYKNGTKYELIIDEEKLENIKEVLINHYFESFSKVEMDNYMSVISPPLVNNDTNLKL